VQPMIHEKAIYNQQQQLNFHCSRCNHKIYTKCWFKQNNKIKIYCGFCGKVLIYTKFNQYKKVKCIYCHKKLLKRNQIRFCSSKCRAAFWYRKCKK
jgi:DNA-directed RNA polymerase subunit RPC12/RpoP